jgi:2-C-methyl-D-erythritol 4-phosphate cytidylyltransferase
VQARTVQETLDRVALVEVQTPQIFRADLLRRAYAADQDMEGATDDAMLVERLGEPVAVIEGDRRNIKITAPGDLPLVRALMGLKAPSQRPAHKRF